MGDFSESIRKACRNLEKGESLDKEPPPFSSYSHKLRESCRRHIQGVSTKPEENNDSPLKSKRHKKFALAQLEIQKLSSRFKATLRSEDDINPEMLESLLTKIKLSPPKNSLLQNKNQPVPATSDTKLKSLIKIPSTRSATRNQVKFMPEILLWDAAFEGDLESLKKATKDISDINKSNYSGVTALHSAVSSPSLECVAHLLNCGANINSTDEIGWTPLHYAAFYGYVDICKYLIENGASVHLRTFKENYTAYDICKGVKSSKECKRLLFQSQNNIGVLNGGIVYSTFDYEKQNEDELSFKAGERLVILKRGNEYEKYWWVAENEEGNAGYVPYTFLI